MKTRNSMQLKARINNKAKAAGVSPQLMLQNYMLERLIDRISRSPWRECVIVKGGMLIGSLIGVDRRTTKDLDTTVRGFTLTHDKAMISPSSCSARRTSARQTNTRAFEYSCAPATARCRFRLQLT